MKHRPDTGSLRLSAGADDDPEMWTSAPPAGSWRGRPPLSLRFGDPAGLFASLAAFFAPLAFLRHTVVPLAALAAVSASFNGLEMERHLAEIALTRSFLQSFLLGLLVTNLIAKVVQGMTMAHCDAPCDEIGMRLAFGILPKFYIAKGAVRQLDFRGQKFCYAAPLLFRLAVYGTGTLVWAMFFRSGSGLAEAALALGVAGLGSFLFTANPLLPADGYRLLAATLERPNLRTHSFRLIGMLVRFRPIPPELPRSEFWLLVFYGVGSLAFTAFVLFWLVTTVATVLEEELRGVGVVIFCLMIAAVMVFFASHAERKRSRKKPAGRRRAAGPAGR